MRYEVSGVQFFSRPAAEVFADIEGFLLKSRVPVESFSSPVRRLENRYRHSAYWMHPWSRDALFGADE